MNPASKIKNRGFTLIEVLLVVAVLGILTALGTVAFNNSRNKAADVRIKNNIRQMRWLAEIAYDAQNTNFTSWSSHPYIADDYSDLVDDITDAHKGAAISVAVGELEVQNFCVSAPLKTDTNQHYCIDASRELKITNAACPDAVTPHVCP